MPFTDNLKSRVLEGANTAELKLEMIRDGVDTLRMDGIKKVLDGVTTVDEVLRVTAADMVAR
jgi:type IV pilus assembly protein PilB